MLETWYNHWDIQYDQQVTFNRFDPEKAPMAKTHVSA